MHTKTSTLLLITTMVFMVCACKTVPKPEEIPLDASPIELAQKGQTALDDNNYKAALVYYQTLLERHGEEPAIRIAAEFELAHLLMKRKQWEEAQSRLETIISAYETTGGADLPPEYLVLAKNDLARIPKDKKK